MGAKSTAEWKWDGQLLHTYTRWTNDRKTYGPEMVATVDRLIHQVLTHTGFDPVYHRTEDRADMIQDLRVKCFECLEKIRPGADNKSIYNYLNKTIERSLWDKGRKIRKKLDREPREQQVWLKLQGREFDEIDVDMLFGDTLLDTVAQYLGNGATKDFIRKDLRLARRAVDEAIQRIKDYYEHAQIAP